MATDTNEASLMASFLLHLSEALDDDDIVNKFQTIMSPLMTPVMDALNQANATIDSLKKLMDEKDNKIATLEQNVWDMEINLVLRGCARNVQNVNMYLAYNWMT